ncbi:unnamed protein product [Ixodes hexagonus]
MSISFIQFTLCELCRVSHNVGKKHVYSKKHQEVVKNVLAKYLRKARPTLLFPFKQAKEERKLLQRTITEAKQYLKAPEVHDLLWEDGAKVWCYFCSIEVPKHERKAEAALSFRCHTFLLHLATAEDIPTVCVCNWQLFCSYRFSHRCESLLKAAEEKYLEKMEKLHQKIDRLTSYFNVCWQKGEIPEAWKTAKMQQLPTSFGSSLPSRPGCSGWSGESHSSAHGRQPTAKGNIFSGARPPWLDDDDDEAVDGSPPTKRTCVGQISQKPIGPSMEDFKQHLEAEKRKKLNPRRVGVNFDHFSETSEEWLPSFGRVWNFGRRWQSR